MPLLDYATSPRRTAGFRSGFGPTRGPSTPQGYGYSGELRRWAHQVVEKVRVATIGGRLRFLPWIDPYTDETPEIRDEYPKMLVESSVKAAFQTKILSVVSLDVQAHPLDDHDPRQKQAADFVSYAMGKVRGGMRRVGWSVLHPAIINGHSVCEKVWQPDPIPSGPWQGKRIFKAVKAKDARFLQLGIDPYRNVTAIRGMGVNAGRVWSPSSFILFRYLDLWENPAGMSDFRAAYPPYWRKQTIWQLRALHLDKFTGPYLHGTYATQDQKDALELALSEAKATTWFTAPVGTLVEAIDLSTRGTSDFEQAIKDCDREILIAIVGAHLQILEGQTAGARGNTKVHKETAELIQWYLAASLADVYHEQFARPLVEENFHGVEPPDVTVGAVTEEEMLNSLKVDQGLQALGIQLSRQDTYKRYARPQPEPDDVLEPPGKEPRSGLSPGGGGFDIGGGFGGPPGPGGPGGGAGGAGGAGEAAFAAPFSEARPFCQEGENAGKPGPCPSHQEVASALKAAHPFPKGPQPIAPPGAGRRDVIAKDPVVAAAVAQRDAWISAHNRATIARTAHDLLTRPAAKPVPFPAAEAAPGKRRGLARKAIEAVNTASVDVIYLGPAFASHQAAVAGTHPHGGAVLEAARQEAQRRYDAALGQAQQHVALLPEVERAGAQKALDTAAVKHAEATSFCQEGVNAGKPGPCPEEGMGKDHGYSREELSALSPGQRKLLAARMGITTRGKSDAEIHEALLPSQKQERESQPVLPSLAPAEHKAALYGLVAALGRGQEQGGSDPRGDLAHLPAGERLTQAQAAIAQAVGEHFERVKVPIAVDRLYALVHEATGLSPEEFRAVLIQGQEKGTLALGSWPRGPDELPRPDLAPVVASRIMSYVRPFSEARRFCQEGPALLETLAELAAEGPDQEQDEDDAPPDPAAQAKLAGWLREAASKKRQG